MTRLGRRAIALTIVCGVAYVAADPGTPMFRAMPPVTVIAVTNGSAGSGVLQLSNELATDVQVGSIVRDATCDPAVTEMPMMGSPPFTIASATNRTVVITCASGVSASMKRCMFHALDPVGVALLDFEGVCQYGASATLDPAMTALTFPSTAVGGTSSISTSVTNNSSMTITKMYFQTDDLDGNFKIGAPCNPDARECDAMVAGVSGGGTASFNVLCTPVSAGLHTARLFITTDSGQHVSGVPGSIALSCTGTSGTGPVISVSPNSIDVGAVEVISTTATSVVHLKNVGGGVLQINAVQIIDGGSGTAADWSYAASGTCTGAIPQICNLTMNQQVDLNVTFDPSLIGSRDATVLVSYTDTALRSTSVPLRGVGRGATLTLVNGQMTLNFGVVPINVTSQSTFQLANGGNRDLTDVALAVTPSGTPFTLSPALATVSPSQPTTVTASCKPTAAGVVTATLHASAPDAFMSPAISIAATCEGTTMALYSNPTTIQLDEIRTQTTPTPTSIMLLSASSQLQITTVALETADPRLILTAATPATTPATIQLAVDPAADGDLANAIVVTASTGNTVRIPIAGKVTTAAYLPPQAISLGTFCVSSATTVGPAVLMSTGTATIRLQPPVMDRTPSSPFDLAFVAPSTYPATLVAGGTATVQLTPKRQSLASVQTDDLVWTTDVAMPAEARTHVTATFVDNGGAIAPPMLAFGPVPIHIDQRNGQSVTLQNCDSTPIIFETIVLDAPFAIDSPSFPSVLAPNETATFSVGFHPTKVGHFVQTLAITSKQLPGVTLAVALSGDGITSGGGGGDGGTEPGGIDHTSFYACGGCSSRQPEGMILVVLAVTCVLVPRRRGRRDRR